MIDAMKCLLKDEYTADTTSHAVLQDVKSGMRVTITNLPAGGLIINIPSTPVSFSIIDNEKGRGYAQSCDNLILIPQDDCTDVYFIEMKRTLRLDESGVPQQACQQIISTIPVLDYLHSMVKIHFGETQKITMHFTVIAEKYFERLDKRLTKPMRLEKYIYKEKEFKTIHSQSIIPFVDL